MIDPANAASGPQTTRLAADLAAGLSMAGLLLPEAVAYAGLAGLPPAAGLIGLLAGLLCYGLVGRSRFAIVASTSSSAALVGATAPSLGSNAVSHAMVAAGLVMLTGIAFLIAATARLGSISNFISKPVLRGFAFGLALSVVIRQIAKMAGVEVQAHATPVYVAELLRQLPRWNPVGLATGVSALLALRLLAPLRRLPGALLVIAAGIAAGQGFGLEQRGVALVGAIDLGKVSLQLPALEQAQWLRLGELAAAMLLLLFAESYGSIRTLALKHGDAVSPNRDLAALGLANLLSGLLQGTPVGAGYSASSANEAAGAASRLAGVIAAVTVTVLMASVLPLVALTPEPVLAAVVVHALAHALSLDGFRPYFGWRRDRLVVVAAALAVLVFGVLDGLLAAIAISLAATLRTLSYPVVNELGRLGNSPDFLSMASHAEVRRVTGLLVLRPEAALFFANIEGVLAAVRRRVDAASPRSLVLSLEETPDLDGTSVEALQDFVGELSARGVRVMLARVKDPVLEVLRRSTGRPLGEDALECGSVDDAVRRLSC